MTAQIRDKRRRGDLADSAAPGERLPEDHPPLRDFRGVIRHPAMNRLYFLEIAAETIATKSGTVAFRMFRS